MSQTATDVFRTVIEFEYPGCPGCIADDKLVEHLQAYKFWLDGMLALLAEPNVTLVDREISYDFDGSIIYTFETTSREVAKKYEFEFAVRDGEEVEIDWVSEVRS